MDTEQELTSVREQLLNAGLAELEAHGVGDFSLRRVAAACDLSCAAPYRHFKDKETLINAVLTHIQSQLRLLLEQIAAVYPNDPRRQLTESCLAYIRFCRATPHARAVIDLADGTLPLLDTVAALLPRCAPSAAPERLQEQALVLRSLTYGAVRLLESGELPAADAVQERIRARILREIDALDQAPVD